MFVIKYRIDSGYYLEREFELLYEAYEWLNAYGHTVNVLTLEEK